MPSAPALSLDDSPHAGETPLALYSRFAELSGAMLLAAQRGDWDAVQEGEQACAQLVAALRQAPSPPATEEEREGCLLLIRKVLADDAAIRDIAQPWLKELEQILRPAHRFPIHTFR